LRAGAREPPLPRRERDWAASTQGTRDRWAPRLLVRRTWNPAVEAAHVRVRTRFSQRYRGRMVRTRRPAVEPICGNRGEVGTRTRVSPRHRGPTVRMRSRAVHPRTSDHSTDPILERERDRFRRAVFLTPPTEEFIFGIQLIGEVLVFRTDDPRRYSPVISTSQLYPCELVRQLPTEHAHAPTVSARASWQTGVSHSCDGTKLAESDVVQLEISVPRRTNCLR
jgi:hypothetical protein